MISEQTYSYLVGYLTERMEKAFGEKYGKKDRKYKALKGYGAYDYYKISAFHLNVLYELFDTAICRSKEKLVRSNAKGDMLYVYNGKWYECIGKPEKFLSSLVKETMRSLNIGGNYLRYASKIAAECFTTISNSDAYQFKPDRRWIAFKNVDFDLKDNKPKPHNSDHVTDIVIDIDYKSEKECNMEFWDVCKLWDKFIEEVLPNKDYRKDFQVFCGGLLVERDKVKIEYMACIHGPGANGKSVLVDAIAGVFGERYFTTFTPKQLFKEGQNSMFNLASMEGALLNMVGDLERTDFSGGPFKDFISGEAQTVRNMWDSSYFRMKPPMMICCANEFPDTGDDTEGHHRRLLPFESTVKMWKEQERDTQLTYKLTRPEARTYIFNWILKGYRRIVNNNWDFPLTDATLKAQERMRDNSNSLRRWWSEVGYCPAPTDISGEWMNLQTLYGEYRQWCEGYGQEQMRYTDLSRLMRSKKVQERKFDGRTQFLVGRKVNDNENGKEE